MKVEGREYMRDEVREVWGEGQDCYVISYVIGHCDVFGSTV